MALIILLSFCLILEVHPQHVSQPQLVVSSTERGSVQLDCKTPYAGVSLCHFYPERDYKNVKLSPSCQLSLTDSELTRWTGHSYRSPEPVRVICYYNVSESGLSKPSPHSLPATVTVLDQKPGMSVRYDSQYEEFTAVCEIPLSGSVRADFRCNLYTGHLLYLKGESRRGNSVKWSCVFTASKTDLLNRLQSVKSRELSCDYSLNSDPSARSPMSDTYDILNLIPVPTQPSITEEKSTAVSLVSSTLITTKGPTTRLPVVPSSSIVTKMSTIATASSAPLPVSTTTAMPSSTAGTTQTTWNYDDYISSDVKSSLLIIVLSVTGTSVLLAGVMIVFPCRFIKKQRTDRLKVNSARGDQGDMMAMLSAAEFGPGAAGTYSMFTSVTAPYQPSGADRTVYTVVIYSLSTQKQKRFSFF
ncbi:uncharacterized protein LOC118799960 isoform X2 [Colossoma macropomum]|uniref:uncharacterized protein LOC118799960 isoform X2 n=1 Tax=Colossoma macropomum TaxID=42526 RepID=UPI0018640093|nr:uncharacterized protein LOC118799960 isoform X2 [Colossoma macropomum]